MDEIEKLAIKATHKVEQDRQAGRTWFKKENPIVLLAVMGKISEMMRSDDQLAQMVARLARVTYSEFTLAEKEDLDREYNQQKQEDDTDG